MQLQPKKNIFGYYPQINHPSSSTIDVNAKEHSLNYILGRGGIRSIIISSLIFFCVFAWVDVFTQLYKNFVMNMNNIHKENFITDPHMLHTIVGHFKFKKPKGVKVNMTKDLNIKQKLGYAIIFTIITYFISTFLINL